MDKPKEVVDLRARYQWKQVEAPKTWRPKMVGEELVGFFGGKTTRTGSFGQYEVVLVHVPARGTFMVTGVRVIQLVDASAIDTGWPIRIAWRGKIKLPESTNGEVREMKNFEVFVAEGDPLSPDELPSVAPQRESRS